MAIFKKSFLDFRSSSQKKQDYEEFQRYMFPFGEDQRRCVERALLGVPKVTPANKLMFLFLVAKERYLELQLEDQDEQTCRLEALRALQKWRFSHKDNLPYLYSLVMLDLRVESLENYPTVREIYAFQKRLFPNGLKHPDWSALEGGR